MRSVLIALPKAVVLSMIFCVGIPVSVYASPEIDQANASEEVKANHAKLVEEQKSAAEAQAAKDAAQRTRDALAAQQASKPNADTERKLKDADYEIMMAERKLSSANKSVERAQKKLDDSRGGEKPSAKTEKLVVEQKAPVVPTVNAAVSAESKKAAEDLARKEAEAKAAAQKASEEAAKKVAEEQARKEAEAKLAAQRASEEAAKKAADEAAAKKRALATELGIDIDKCIALPTVPTKASTSLNPAEQAYAQGFLKQLNQLIAKKAADDVPPISPFPVLEGSKLSPCDPNQKQALKFGYIGNGQYRLETPVLAGEQVFTVKNIVQPLNRIIPESDNGETYVFFLDGREGRTQLTAYKKSLLEAAPQQ